MPWDCIITGIICFIVGNWFGLFILGLMAIASDERKDKDK